MERGSENTHIHKNPKPKNKKTPPHNNKQNNKKPPKKLGPEMPAEEREIKMGPWNTMLPAVMTGFDCWPFSYSLRCWIIWGVLVFWFLIKKKSFWPSLVIV